MLETDECAGQLDCFPRLPTASLHVVHDLSAPIRHNFFK